MKWLAVVFFLLVAASSRAEEFSSHRVVHINGDINYTSGLQITKEMMADSYEPGPVLVFIDSNGGFTEVGKQIILLMEAMKSQGDTFICMVTGGAHSMAFNILTHCDIRTAVKTAKFLVHKTRFTLYAGRYVTAKQLMTDAKVLLDDDQFFDGPNAEAMKLSRKEFDKYADKETQWSAKVLLKRGYLNGYLTIDADNQPSGSPAPQGK